MAVTIKLKQSQIARAECVLAASKSESISAAQGSWRFGLKKRRKNR